MSRIKIHILASRPASSSGPAITSPFTKTAQPTHPFSQVSRSPPGERSSPHSPPIPSHQCCFLKSPFSQLSKYKGNFLTVPLISLGFWIDIRPFQNQVSPQRRGDRRGELFFCSNRETAIGAETLPSKIRSNAFHGRGTDHEPCPKQQESFDLRSSPRKSKNLSSLRPLRLCGETRILECARQSLRKGERGDCSGNLS